MVALLLAEARPFPAALKHLELVGQARRPRAGGRHRPCGASRGNPGISPWLKDRLELANRPRPTSTTTPGGGSIEGPRAGREAGLWAPAAGDLRHGSPATSPAARPTTTSASAGSGSATRSAPSGRSADDPGSSAIRPEAVDLEVLAQQIEPIHPDDRVEHVQLIWPLRNREALLDALRSRKPDIFDEGPAPLDPDDPESPEVDTFALLDKPAIDHHDGEGPDPPTRSPGSWAGSRSARRSSRSRPTTTAGSTPWATASPRWPARSIAPAHPRTKVLGEDSRSTWPGLGVALPRRDGSGRGRAARPRAAGPGAPGRLARPSLMPYLGFRTPEKAVQGRRTSTIPLRAALCQYEQDAGNWRRRGSISTPSGPG